MYEAPQTSFYYDEPTQQFSQEASTLGFDAGRFPRLIAVIDEKGDPSYFNYKKNVRYNGELVEVLYEGLDKTLIVFND